MTVQVNMRKSLFIERLFLCRYFESLSRNSSSFNLYFLYDFEPNLDCQNKNVVFEVKSLD